MKCFYNKVFDMISRPIISATTLVKNVSIVHESYIEQYASDVDFKDVYANLSEGNMLRRMIIT